MNPTTDVFEQRMAALEGARARWPRLPARRPSPIPSRILPPAEITSCPPPTVYGGTYNLFANTLPHYGLKTTFLDPDELSHFEKAIRPNTKAIYVESSAIPTAISSISLLCANLRTNTVSPWWWTIPCHALSFPAD